ncbi:hypothetical protein M409DRAFT_25994 [Zasmidium cellare ATCC 36951]|uniref:Uncharacterized protein n=1 Tax=Zasmidium cellare ATCC 36951 TaxID=1080233 RepID=A0A6A6CAF5_ZASCE|nr:uncharacterized protein M409DRAFT_25994 [Zasmidium cellare ATCC 36951]KAF2163813.1 hypothetical protein M409DRAFT_25994 [Zasmidium cellare ATCC 36951]
MAAAYESPVSQTSPPKAIPSYEEPQTIHHGDTIAQKAHKLILDLSHQIMLFYSDDPLALKDISHLLAPDYSVLLDCTQTDYDMQSYREYCRYLERISPKLDIHVINATAQIVNYSCGVVYIPFMMNGLPGNLSRKVTHVLKWRKRDGQWMCYGHLGFQGMNLPAGVSEQDEEKEIEKGIEERKKDWWHFPQTSFEDSKKFFLSTMEIPPERPPMSKAEIDDILMKRFT